MFSDRRSSHRDDPLYGLPTQDRHGSLANQVRPTILRVQLAVTLVGLGLVRAHPSN